MEYLQTEPLDVAIIGAGLAGLSAAVHLQQAGKSIKIFESSSRIGGKVTTDLVDGFLLDKGFQVLLTAYPECKRQLNYELLNLHSFDKGALIWKNSKFDQLRIPSNLFSAISEIRKSQVIAKGDLLKLITMMIKLYFESPDITVEKHTGNATFVLKQLGFSDLFTDSFLKPFFRGVLLDYDLTCPGILIHYILKMFIQGDAALPANGIQAIPQQLADKLQEDTILFRKKVRSIEPHLVTTSHGDTYRTKEILLACDQWSQAELLKSSKLPPGKEIYCIYFAAEKPPLQEKMLILNGEKVGLVNNLAILSNIAPSYAPTGSALISATVLPHGQQMNSENLDHSVKDELKVWFGDQVNAWKHLKTYRILNAHPTLYPMPSPDPQHPYFLRHGIWQCGDFLEAPSIQSSMKTGREAAEAIIRHI